MDIAFANSVDFASSRYQNEEPEGWGPSFSKLAKQYNVAIDLQLQEI